MKLQANNNNRKLKPFWRQDGADFIADVGVMKKAIVIRRFTTDIHLMNTYYAIAHASYFPFTDEQYEIRFHNYIDACELAERHILTWLNSIMADFSISDTNHLMDGQNPNIPLL